MGIVAVAFALPVLLSGPPPRSQSRSLDIEASPIASFDSGGDTDRFGSLIYVGGFQYSSSDSRLRGVSGLRLTEDRSRFVAVTDTGYWFLGRILRDAEGRPTGLADAEMAPILGTNGEARTRRKGLADAEGLAIDGDRVLVAFERSHAVETFANAADPSSSVPSIVAQPIPRGELRSNAGMEAIAVSSPSAPGGKRTVVVTEQSIDSDGNLFAAVLGPENGVFKVRREVPWHVTDGDFLPGGDLLLLERRYQSFGRVGMRIRRIAGADIRPGVIVDGTVLMEADLSQEIDNMEGLAVSTGADDATYVTLVSDDNGNFFQRNLFLEFRLDEAGATTGSVQSN